MDVKTVEAPERVPLRKKSSSTIASNNQPSFNPEGEVRVACEILSLAFVTIGDHEAEDGPDEESNVFTEILRPPPTLIATTNTGLIAIDIRSRNLGDILSFKVLSVITTKITLCKA